MTTLVLKIIALITMTIDHIGVVFLNNNSLFRFIGRIAFPIYGFMLAIGFYYTKNDKKKYINYISRIFILAIITEPFYDKLFYNTYFYFYNQNILFTLFIALICMIIYEQFKQSLIHKITGLLIVLMIAFISQLTLDYGLCGILLIFIFNIIYSLNINDIYKKLLYCFNILIYMILLNFFYKTNYVLIGTILSLIPICLYNNKLGYNKKIVQLFFYLYYPVHIIIMLLIRNLL